MPSSDPFEMTIATFWTASTAGAANGVSSRTLVMVVLPFLDAAARLRDAADLRCELRGPLREELVQLLDGDAGLLAERANRRRGAARQEPLAHELDHEPMPVRKLRDPGLMGDPLRELVIPLRRVEEEALRVDGDRLCNNVGHFNLLRPRPPAASLPSACSARRAAGRVPAAARASRSTGRTAFRDGSAATPGGAAAVRAPSGIGREPARSCS